MEHTQRRPARVVSAPSRLLDGLQRWLPKLVIAPTFVLIGIGIYGYMLWTGVLSFTSSSFLPTYDFVGFDQYAKLMANDRWLTASKNLAIFGGLFIFACLFIGVVLAIFLDQRIRQEGAIRTIYLYPMALSMIVTGTVWKWILNPSLGLEKLMHDWGWTSFSFDWLVNSDLAIYTIVMAAVWLCHGAVPCRPARCRFLHHSGGPGRRCQPATDLLEDYPAVTAAGVLQRGHGAGSHRHQEL